MKWSDIPMDPKPRVLRQFSAAWLMFFLAAGAVQYGIKGRPHLGVALAAVAVTIGGAGLVRPVWVRWVFVGSMVLAFPVGWVVSLVMLFVIFYGVLTPMGVLLRLRGHDPLKRRPAPERSSFWEPKEPPREVGSYFRQY